MNSNVENLINKIFYRAKYRGSKEMDIFVSSFVDSIVNELNFGELNDLNKIINLNDEKILDLCDEKNEKNEFNKKIVLKLVNFKKKK
tara:strand:+ start:259 stop:519 length:261 start_codon:yes stop_codon:yes gene_type:complete